MSESTANLFVFSLIGLALIGGAIFFYGVIKVCWRVYRDFKGAVKDVAHPPHPTSREEYVGPQENCPHCKGDGYITITQHGEEVDELCGCTFREITAQQAEKERSEWINKLKVLK